jgi:hypothetical protein
VSVAFGFAVDKGGKYSFGYNVDATPPPGATLSAAEGAPSRAGDEGTLETPRVTEPPASSGPTSQAPADGSAPSPLGLPPSSSCVPRRQIAFRLRRPRGRVVDVQVFVDGTRWKHITGRNITRLTIRRLPERSRFSVTVVATNANGRQLVSRRVYRPCGKSAPKASRRSRR